MEARREDEVSRPPAGDLGSKHITATISSLNEAWVHTLDEYVADTLLSQVILSLMRACFFGGATYAGLMLGKGHADRVRCRYSWLPHRTAAVVIPKTLSPH
jgi:hypothetical protein